MNSMRDESSGNTSIHAFSANGRTYDPSPRPIVVICIDGCADEYLSTSLDYGRMPNLKRVIPRGYRGMVRGALPSFTNVNNTSITTGMPPAVTGFGGNFFIDPESGEEVMMNSAKYLRCETILAAAANAGRHVAMVTAKNKLLDILSHDLKGIAFSSEFADQAQEATHGIGNVEELVGRSTPKIYSADASLFVLSAGAKLIERNLADFLYLSLTDYMQHKFEPHTPESLDFYEGMDTEIGKMIDLGAIVGITADHGMNAKANLDGSPNVVYLESLLNEKYGTGNKVICPITDPYVVHHGSLGSEVMVYLKDPSQTTEIVDWVNQLDGITEVYDRPGAVKNLELPGDRIGDMIVMSARDVVIGRTPEDHDLALVKGGLRSHGGRYEEMVPMVVSERLNDQYMAIAAADARNFDIFDFVCNGTDAQ